MSNESPNPGRPPSTVASLFRSKALWVGIAVTVLSAAWWIYGAVQARSAAPAPSPSGLTGNLVAGQGAAGAGQPTGEAIPDAPLSLALGASFVGGFALAWLFRRFVRVALIVSGTLVLAIAALKASGLIELDWATVESQVDAGLEAAQSHASAARDWLWTALPSGFTALLGAFFGFRRA